MTSKDDTRSNSFWFQGREDQKNPSIPCDGRWTWCQLRRTGFKTTGRFYRKQKISISRLTIKRISLTVVWISSAHTLTTSHWQHITWRRIADERNQRWQRAQKDKSERRALHAQRPNCLLLAIYSKRFLSREFNTQGHIKRKKHVHRKAHTHTRTHANSCLRQPVRSREARTLTGTVTQRSSCSPLGLPESSKWVRRWRGATIRRWATEKETQKNPPVALNRLS